MPQEYTVQEGDTFLSIARKFFGSVNTAENADKIFQANQTVGGVGNNVNELNYEHEGHTVVLTIPDDEPAPTAEEAPPV